MGNLLPHELDPRADLVQGTPKLPWSMMAGIEEGMTRRVFVGYHAGAGTSEAVLDHTYSGSFTEVRVNGEPWNETHLNAALAGTFGVPVVFVVRRPRVLRSGEGASAVGQDRRGQGRDRRAGPAVHSRRSGRRRDPRPRAGGREGCRAGAAEVWIARGPVPLGGATP